MERSYHVVCWTAFIHIFRNTVKNNPEQPETTMYGTKNACQINFYGVCFYESKKLVFR